jgi:hypothetical protein
MHVLMDLGIHLPLSRGSSSGAESPEDEPGQEIRIDGK